MKTIKLLLTIASLGLLILTASAQSWNTNGLVAYYPFNGNANDASGHSDNGVVVHAAFALDRFGKPERAYHFDGSPQIGIQALGTYLPLGSQPRTMSLWINPDNLVTNLAETWIAGGLFQYGLENGGAGLCAGQFAWQTTPGVVSFYLGTENVWGWNSWLSNWDFSRWHHVVWTVDGNTNALLYVDGNVAAFASSSAGVTFDTQSGPLLIGIAAGNGGGVSLFQRVFG